MQIVKCIGISINIVQLTTNNTYENSKMLTFLKHYYETLSIIGENRLFI